jgi:hypothetical protein
MAAAPFTRKMQRTSYDVSFFLRRAMMLVESESG